MQKLRSVEHSLLTENVLKVLAQSRITTILDFLQEDTERLSNITKLNISEILAVRGDIFNKYSAPLINGATLLKKSLTKERKFIETGLPRLDSMLGGGLPIGTITEMYGLADSGKTQLCFLLAINNVKNTDSTVLYIDTKGDFSSIRIQKMLDVQGLSHKEMAVIMNKIKVVHIWNMEEIIDLLQKIKNKLLNFENLSIIIIDSLPCLMFQYLGDNNKIGLSFLNNFVNYCRFLCNDMDISVICVNICTRWVDQDVSDLEDEQEQSTTAYKDVVYIEKQNRCLGNYWRHVPSLLLLLEKSPANDSSYSHNIHVTDMSSYDRENKKCILNCNNSGIIL